MIILQKNSIKIGYKIKKFKFRNSAVVRMSLSQEIRRHNTGNSRHNQFKEKNCIKIG